MANGKYKIPIDTSDIRENRSRPTTPAQPTDRLFANTPIEVHTPRSPGMIAIGTLTKPELG